MVGRFQANTSDWPELGSLVDFLDGVLKSRKIYRKPMLPWKCDSPTHLSNMLKEIASQPSPEYTGPNDLTYSENVRGPRSDDYKIASYHPIKQVEIASP